MRLTAAHKLLGLVALVFVVAHLANHVAMFWGIDRHIAVQTALRSVYQHPVVEPILLVGFATQIFLGVKLSVRRGWPRHFWPRIQLCSGAILALFLIQHIGAALYARTVWPEIDTNMYWAASVVSRAPLNIYFVPYYLLGVAAIFVHVAAFFAVKLRWHRMAILTCVQGIALSIALVTTLSGVFYPINLPVPYTAYLDGLVP